MKKKTILISAVIAVTTIIAFKHIFKKDDEEYFLNENYPFGSNAEKIKMNRNKKNRIPCKLLYNKNSQLLIGCFCFLRKYSIVCFNYMSDVNMLSNA